MTGFSDIVLFTVSFFATINFFWMFTDSRRIFHFYLGSSVLFLAIIGAAGFLAELFPILDAEFIRHWSSVFAISIALSAAAAQIRDSRPVFTRFPRFLTVLPLILILLYPFIMDTIVIKVWVLLLYQGSAISIGLLIYGYKAYRDPLFGYMLVGLIFFLVTFLLYWSPSDDLQLPDYTWILLISCGVLIISVGYNKIYKNGLEESLIDKSQNEWFI